jgi:anti-sigma regulatory factor (Ser/Thr protein kinase)
VAMAADEQIGNAGWHHERLRFPALPSAVAICRHHVRGLLSQWRTPASLDVAELLVSEIATNAILYGTASGAPGAEVLVDLDETADGLEVRVRDSGTGLRSVSRNADPSALRESGRGLFLVDELSDGWGHESGPDGTTVYFLLRYAEIIPADAMATENHTGNEADAFVSDPLEVGRQCDSHTTRARRRRSRNVRSTQPTKLRPNTTTSATASVPAAGGCRARSCSPAITSGRSISGSSLSLKIPSLTQLCFRALSHRSHAPLYGAERGVGVRGGSAAPDSDSLSLRRDEITPRVTHGLSAARAVLGDQDQRDPDERIPGLNRAARLSGKHETDREP